MSSSDENDARATPGDEPARAIRSDEMTDEPGSNCADWRTAGESRAGAGLMVTIVEHSRSAEVVMDGLIDWTEALTGNVAGSSVVAGILEEEMLFWLLLRDEGVVGNDSGEPPCPRSPAVDAAVDGGVPPLLVPLPAPDDLVPAVELGMSMITPCSLANVDRGRYGYASLSAATDRTETAVPDESCVADEACEFDRCGACPGPLLS